MHKPSFRANIWLTLAVLTIASSLMFGGTIVSLGVYVPVLERGEGWAAEHLGAAATVLLFSISISGIVAGFIIERWRTPHVIFAGVLLVGLGCWLGGATASAGTFISAMAVLGTGLGFATIVPSIPLISRLFGPRRGMALGVYFAMLAFSAGVLPMGVSALIENLGWRMTMHVTAVAILMAGLMLLVINPPAAPGKEVGAGGADISTKTGIPLGPAMTMWGFWALSVGMALALISVQGVLFSVVAYFVASGMTSFKAVNIFGIANMVGMPALFAIGALTDRLGARRVLPVGLLLQGAGTLTLLFAVQQGAVGWMAIGAFILFWGASSGLSPQVGPMLLEDAFGKRHFSALLGINTAVVGILGALGPFLAAWFRETGGSFAAVFIACAMMAFVAAPLVFSVRPRFRTAALSKGK